MDWRRHYAGLDGFRPEANDRAAARCPFHEDRKASLRVNLLTGWTECFAGCGTWNPDEFADLAGLPRPGPNGNGKHRDERSAPWPEYIYRAADGAPVFRVLRTPDKQFPQSHWDGNRWQKGLTRADGSKVERLLYRVPELAVAPLDEPVFLTEGEKDVHTLAERLGLTATTFSGGAGKAGLTPASALDVLQGRKVYILPDADEPGRKHAQQVLTMLQKAGIPARVLPPFPGVKDVSDWVAAGGTRAQLLELATRDASEPKPAPRPSPAVFHRMSTVTPQRVEWLVQNRIALGKLAVIGGPPGQGKSLTTIALAAAVTRGTPFLPDTPACPQGSVLLLSAEDDPGDTLRPRLDAAGADSNRVIALTMVRNAGPDGALRTPSLKDDLPIIEQLLQDELPDCRLIVIDPITAYLGIGSVDSYKDSDVRSILHPLADLAGRLNVAVLVVMHHRKAAGGSADYRIGGSLGFVAAARTVLHVAPDPQDATRRLLLPGKSNLGPPAPGWAYRVEEVGGAPFVHWIEPVHMTADDALAERSEEASALDEAEAWLRDALALGPVAVDKLLRDSRRAGIAERTLRRAKDNLRVQSGKMGFGSGWTWGLPAEGGQPLSLTVGHLHDGMNGKAPSNGTSSEDCQDGQTEGGQAPSEGGQVPEDGQPSGSLGHLRRKAHEMGLPSSSLPPQDTEHGQTFGTTRARARDDDEYLMEVPLL